MSRLAILPAATLLLTSFVARVTAEELPLPQYSVPHYSAPQYSPPHYSASELPAPTFSAPVSRDSFLHEPEEIHGVRAGRVPSSSRADGAELITERYSNRAVKLQRYVIQDAQRNYINHGSWKFFDLQGRVLMEGEYRHGKLHGPWKRMMPQFVMADPQFRGPFTSQAEFQNGQLHGTWTINDAQQRVIGSWQFANGKLDGVSTTWYPNGRQRREMKFKQGVPSGEAMAWQSNGSVLAKEVFRDGKQLVHAVTWHDRQQKESEGWYVRSNFHIHIQADWWNGILEITREPSNGEDLKTGKWTEWYANGSKKFEGTFDESQPTGQHTWWHPNGQRMLAGRYDAGLSEGLWTRWHATGMKQEEGTYLAGVKTGMWTLWSEDGQVLDELDMRSETAIASDEAFDPFGQNVSHILLNDPPRPSAND